jgi:predicted PurR-regulated permease PerM
MKTTNQHRAPTACEYAAWTLSILGVVFVMEFRLVPALIAGLMVYGLVRILVPVFSRRLSTRRAKGVAVSFVVLVVFGAVTAVGFGIAAFLKSEHGSLAVLLARMADIVESSRATLPQWLAAYLPSNTARISDKIGQWLREHAADLQRIGQETGRSLAHILIGMVIGALASLRQVFDKASGAPLAVALTERIWRLGEAFRRIVFAQVRISAINAALTGVYLVVALPLFGVSLPLTKTMIAVTFIVGLLPVVGNLISNTVVVIVSLAYSPTVALASLGFLVLIHKLEYFLNARIVGDQINARPCELLAAMLAMEAAFGIPGLVAAPICYAWLKDELQQRGLI